ncbi:MAG: glycosyltransferase [Desulfobacteraceae bacterium]
MNIAILHYHLMRGGVTTVIRQQVDALNAQGWNVMVLSGAPCESAFPAHIATLPELGYDSRHTCAYSSENISNKIIAAIRDHWPQGADVIHIHNPTLAKNRYLQEVLAHLQKSGMRLLCQIHDFAEDGRPGAYYRSAYLRDCHYAVINQRDHRLLLDAGLDPRGCHLLPNAVSSINDNGDSTAPADVVLYPIRAIRRKNIGEALLLSHFLEKDISLAITLPPNSPGDKGSYAHWQSFARRRNLPVRFGVGLGADYIKLLSTCRYVLTTSITEGFGFAYLEPWLAGKALWGRLLKDTCSGFIARGVELEHLYTLLQVDLEWLDADALEMRWKAAFHGAAQRFQVPVSRQEVETAWQQICSDGCIDFGLLSEEFQQQVLDRAMDDRGVAAALKALNPFLHRPAPPETIGAAIQRNAAIISAAYNPDQYRRRLSAVYRAVVDTSLSHAIDKRIVSRYFLSPRSFSLLKWEPFGG